MQLRIVHHGGTTVTGDRKGSHETHSIDLKNKRGGMEGGDRGREKDREAGKKEGKKERKGRTEVFEHKP